MILFLSKFIRLAALSRRYLKEASKLGDSLLPGAELALLSGISTEHYLEVLEKKNFNVFNPTLNKYSRFVIPFRMLKAARQRKFVLYL